MITKRASNSQEKESMARPGSRAALEPAVPSPPLLPEAGEWRWTDTDYSCAPAWQVRLGSPLWKPEPHMSPNDKGTSQPEEAEGSGLPREAGSVGDARREAGTADDAAT